MNNLCSTNSLSSQKNSIPASCVIRVITVNVVQGTTHWGIRLKQFIIEAEFQPY